MAIILPGDPLFDWTLATTPPPGSRGADYLVADCETGIYRVASPEDLTEYLWGGEYSERMRAIGDSDDPEESAWIAEQEQCGGHLDHWNYPKTGQI